MFQNKKDVKQAYLGKCRFCVNFSWLNRHIFIIFPTRNLVKNFFTQSLSYSSSIVSSSSSNPLVSSILIFFGDGSSRLPSLESSLISIEHCSALPFPFVRFAEPLERSDELWRFPMMFGSWEVAATMESRGAGTPGGKASSPCWDLLKF